MADVNIGTFLQPFAERAGRLPVLGAFLLFNTVLIGGVGGLLWLMRHVTDEYAAVPLSGLNLVLVASAYAACLAAFGALFLSAKANTGLNDLGALLVATAFLEIVGSGHLAHCTFTVIPRSHLAEQSADLVQLLAESAAELPKKINAAITLKAMFFVMHSMYLTYDLKNADGHGYNQAAMHDVLQRQSCQWLRDNANYSIIDTLIHTFYTGDVVTFAFAFHRKDCTGVAAAGAPPTSSFDPRPSALGNGLEHR